MLGNEGNESSKERKFHLVLEYESSSYRMNHSPPQLPMSCYAYDISQLGLLY